MFDLRQYQIEDQTNIRREFSAGHKHVLYQLPTGGGKTVTSSHMIKGAEDKGHPSMFIAHRREIIYQTESKLIDAGIDYSMIMAGEKPSMMSTVNLASIQTLIRREFPSAKFIIIDEAHHVVATSYQKVIKQYPEAWILGLTATPCRADGRGLGGVFDRMVCGPSVRELIDLGYLVPPRIFSAEIPSLEELRITMRDYDMDDAQALLNTPKLVGDIVEHYMEIARGKKFIAFTSRVAHSLHLVEALTHAGVKVAHLDGTTPTEVRKVILAQHKSGEILGIINCGVLTEGYDDPTIEAVIIARPTKSFGLYLQMSGRGLRPSVETGKVNLILLDHANCFTEHGGPDEPVAWSLDPDKPAAQVDDKVREESKLSTSWICELCRFVNQAGNYCGSCGMRKTTNAIAPVVAQGKLKEVTDLTRRKLGKLEKEKAWESCVWKAIQIDRRAKKGMKVGAAFHMFVKETGQQPHHSYPMMPKRGEWQMRASKWYEMHKARGVI